MTNNGNGEYSYSPEDELLAICLINTDLLKQLCLKNFKPAAFGNQKTGFLFAEMMEALIKGAPLVWPDRLGGRQVPQGSAAMLRSGRLKCTFNRVEELADRIAEATRRKRLQALGQRLETAALHIPSKELLRDVSLELAAIGNTSLAETNEYDGEHMAAFIEQVQKERRENPTQIRGIATGFPMMDAYIGGLRKQTVSLWRGDPKFGKTTLMTNMLGNICLGLDGRPEDQWEEGLDISLESFRGEIADNLHALITKQEKRKILLATDPGTDGVRAAEVLRAGKLTVACDSPRTISDVVVLLRKYAALKNLGFAVVDYLTNIDETREDPFKENERLKKWVRTFENLARELNMHIAIVSQQNADGDPFGSRQMTFTARYVFKFTEGDRLILEYCTYAQSPIGVQLHFDRKRGIISEKGIITGQEEPHDLQEKFNMVA